MSGREEFFDVMDIDYTLKVSITSGVPTRFEPRFATTTTWSMASLPFRTRFRSG